MEDNMYDGLKGFPDLGNSFSFNSDWLDKIVWENRQQMRKNFMDLILYGSSTFHCPPTKEECNEWKERKNRRGDS